MFRNLTIADHLSHGLHCTAALTGMLAIVALSACAANPGAARPFPSTAPGDAHLVVNNHHGHAVEIVVRSERNSAFRLGTVRVQSNREILLPRSMNNAPVELTIRCLETGEVHETREVVWNPADRLAIRLEPLLSMSMLTLR